MLEQPKEGFRIAVDTVLLAASVHAVAGQRVLDLGCGVGGALLALAARVSDIQGLGIEIQSELAALARANIARNALQAKLDISESDVARFQADAPFDHVMINPPYYEEESHDVSANPIKRKANSAKDGELAAWLGVAEKSLRDGGILTLIHRADRMRMIIDLLPVPFVEVDVVEILPKAGAEPKRVLIRAKKSHVSLRELQRCKPLTLHKAEGGYTDDAEEILRHAKAVAFTRQ